MSGAVSESALAEHLGKLCVTEERYAAGHGSLQGMVIVVFDGQGGELVCGGETISVRRRAVQKFEQYARKASGSQRGYHADVFQLDGNSWKRFGGCYKSASLYSRKTGTPMLIVCHRQERGDKGGTILPHVHVLYCGDGRKFGVGQG